MRHISVKRIKSFRKKLNVITFICETSNGGESEVRLTICADRIFRLQFYPDRHHIEDGSIIELKEADKQPEFTVADAEEYIKISTDTVEVKVRKDPWNLRVYNKDDIIICCQATDDLDAHGLYRSHPIGYTIDSEGQISCVNETMMLFPDEHFYGLGEKFTELDKKGRTITCWNVNPFGSGTEESYKNIPFMISSRGYGIFLNSTYRSLWKLGSESNMSYTFLTDGKNLDYFFMYGPSLKEVLQEYSEVTGKPEMPPLWSFGAWFTVYIWDDLSEVEEICKKMMENGVPCDVMFIEGDFRLWMGNVEERGSLEWNERSTPKLKRIVDVLSKYGIKLMLAESPYVDVNSELFHKLNGLGYLVKGKDGRTYIANLGLKYVQALDRVKAGRGRGIDTYHASEVDSGRLVKDRLVKNWREKHLAEFYSPAGIFDFTNPEAVSWWKEMHKMALKAGVKAFFCDFGEDIPTDTYFFNGDNGEKLHNIYPLLYHKATFEAMREYGVEGVLCNRSGYVGSQRYPIHWSGDPNSDFQDLHCNVRAGLNLGLSGIAFWSHDTGGFSRLPDEELMIRWLQLSVFSSHIRFHGNIFGRVDGPRIPWLYRGKTFETIRNLIRLRYELTPYILSYAFEASKTGLPVMRAMILEFQDDPNTHTIDSQYMFGEELLVAPIIEPNNTRIVYLPSGLWIDYWSKKVYSGPLNLEYKAPLETVPLFVKMNSIVPKLPERSNLSIECLNEVILDFYVQTSTRFNLYDGEREAIIECFRKDREIDVKISSSKKSYLARFHLVEKPKEVIWNEKPISEIDTRKDLEKTDSAWIFDEVNKTVIVKFTADGEKTSLKVIF